MGEDGCLLSFLGRSAGLIGVSCTLYGSETLQKNTATHFKTGSGILWTMVQAVFCLWAIAGGLNGSSAADFAAADALACVAGRLGVEIVRAAVDDDGAARYLLRREPVCVDLEVGVAVFGGEKGRQVACVVGVGHIIGVVVAAGGQERIVLI